MKRGLQVHENVYADERKAADGERAQVSRGNAPGDDNNNNRVKQFFSSHDL